VRALLLVAAIGLTVQPVHAQGAWVDPVRVSFSVGVQPGTTRIAQSIVFEQNVEAEPVTARLPRSAVPFFDAGVAERLVGNVGVGVAVSYASGSGDADVRAEIPHPFYFDRLRPVTGQAFGVRHRELAVHTDLVYLMALHSIDLALSGGPSFFRVGQDLVSEVSVTEAYPYDTATFSRATLTRATKSRVGYNAGVDVTWRVSRSWGVGGLVRFARARVPFALDGVDAGTVTVGGIQAAAGLRFIVPSGSSQRPAPPSR